MASKKSHSGQLIWRRGGWSGRYYSVVDGERVRVCVPLGTENKASARIKLARLVAGESHEKVAQAETFAEAARRIVASQGIKHAGERLSRLERFAFPEFGAKPVTSVRASDIRGALEAYAAGHAAGSVHHLLSDIRGVFDQLWRDEIVPENPALRAKIPASASVDHRPRVVLTDAELAALLVWPELPSDLATMAVISRCVGGMRTSDLHSWDWAQIDWESSTAVVPRPKTKSVTRLVLPELAIPVLMAWWERSGRPTTGAVFPALRGKQAGKTRVKPWSHAARLRRALWAAGVRRGPTKAECQLQADTAETRRVDFHSFRRQFNTGLAAAGVNVQLAMKLAGHTNPNVHMRYVKLTEALGTPIAALPRALPVPIMHQRNRLTSGDHMQSPAQDTVRISQQPGPNLPGSFSFNGSGGAQKSPKDVPVPEARASASDAALSAYLHALASCLAPEVAS